MARHFNGVNQNVEVDGIANIDSLTMSYTVWVRMDHEPTSDELALMRTNAVAGGGTIWCGLSCFPPVTSGFRVIFFQQWSTQFGSWHGADLSLNIWHRIVVTYDGNATGNDAVIYHDGVSQSVTELDGPPAGTHQTGYDAIVIGEDEGGAGDLDGDVDDLAVWDVILTPNEARSLSFGVPPWKIRSANCRLNWPLWGTHDPEIDLTSNGNNGTLVNAPTVIGGAPKQLFTPKADSICTVTPPWPPAHPPGPPLQTVRAPQPWQ